MVEKIKKAMIMRAWILVGLLLFTTNLFSAGSNVDEYSLALQKAQKENKIIMLTVVSTNCPWCMRFKKETLLDTDVGKMLKQDFVQVIINKDTQSVPSGFKSRLVPTTYFIDTKGRKMPLQAVGFYEPAEFIDFLSDAIKKGKK